jgi:hypothetical protein
MLVADLGQGSEERGRGAEERKFGSEMRRRGAHKGKEQSGWRNGAALVKGRDEREGAKASKDPAQCLVGSLGIVCFASGRRSSCGDRRTKGAHQGRCHDRGDSRQPACRLWTGGRPARNRRQLADGVSGSDAAFGAGADGHHGTPDRLKQRQQHAGKEHGRGLCCGHASTLQPTRKQA